MATLRGREYLTPDEVERLMTAARTVGRHGHRDATLILIAYRHGLRVSELVGLRWDQLDLKTGNPPRRAAQERAAERASGSWPGIAGATAGPL